MGERRRTGVGERRSGWAARVAGVAGGRPFVGRRSERRSTSRAAGRTARQPTGPDLSHKRHVMPRHLLQAVPRECERLTLTLAGVVGFVEFVRRQSAGSGARFRPRCARLALPFDAAVTLCSFFPLQQLSKVASSEAGTSCEGCTFCRKS